MKQLAELFSESLFFGVTVTVIAYGIGIWVKRKIKISAANPILTGTLVVIAVLKLTGVSYDAYTNGARYISYLLTPATICLAIPLYEKLRLLKENAWAVFAGILTGVFCSAFAVGLVCMFFTLDESVFFTMLPKSVTTPIGMAISKEMGGVENITVAMIVITGIFGNVFSDWVYRLFHIEDPVAKGIALGTSAHVLGTAHALELGETEGAMSGLAVAVAGIITVILAPFLAGI